MTIEEKVRIIFRDTLGCEDYEIYPKARLREDLNIGERIAYEIYQKLKDEFQVEATKQEALKLVTFHDAVNLIKKKLVSKMKINKENNYE